MGQEGSDKLAREKANDLISSGKVDETAVGNPHGGSLGSANKAAARLWARATGADPMLSREAEAADRHSRIQGDGMRVSTRPASSTAKREWSRVKLQMSSRART